MMLILKIKVPFVVHITGPHNVDTNKVTMKIISLTFRNEISRFIVPLFFFFQKEKNLFQKCTNVMLCLCWLRVQRLNTSLFLTDRNKLYQLTKNPQRHGIAPAVWGNLVF